MRVRPPGGGNAWPHMASNENVRQNPGVCMVGHVSPSAAAPVLMKSRIGANRIVDTDLPLKKALEFPI